MVGLMIVQSRIRIQPPMGKQLVGKQPMGNQDLKASSILFVAAYNQKLQQEQRLQPMMTRNQVVRRAEQD